MKGGIQTLKNTCEVYCYDEKKSIVFNVKELISLLYILSVTGYYLIKIKSNWAIGFWVLIGLIMISISALTFNPSTIGGSIYFWITSVCGLLFMGVAYLIWSKVRKHQLVCNTIES